MVEKLFTQLRSRGEDVLTEVSNNLMANPAFIEVLKKGVAAKEEILAELSVFGFGYFALQLLFHKMRAQHNVFCWWERL